MRPKHKTRPVSVQILLNKEQLERIAAWTIKNRTSYYLHVKEVNFYTYLRYNGMKSKTSYIRHDSQIHALENNSGIAQQIRLILCPAMHLVFTKTLA